MTSGELASWAGALAVAAGIAMSAWQLVRPRPQHMQTRGMTGKAGPVNLKLQTTYPGIIIVGLGVLLLAIGVVLGR